MLLQGGSESVERRSVRVEDRTRACCRVLHEPVVASSVSCWVRCKQKRRGRKGTRFWVSCSISLFLALDSQGIWSRLMLTSPTFSENPIS